MDLIYVKDIDKSVLYQGFTIRSSLLQQFLEKFGELAIGEKRDISIIWNSQIYDDIQVVNQNFDRIKYPDHPEMYQVRYNPTSKFSRDLRASFHEITQFVDQQIAINKQIRYEGGKTSIIKIPDNLRCSIVFYTTDNPNVWEAVPVYASEVETAKKQIVQYTIDEPTFENMLLNDESAHIEKEPQLVKIRKVDRKVCLNLKKLYGYRCQICGKLITEPYGGEEKVIEAHHIIPFTQSLNNNFSNIMILCPNHHRIIHAYHPEFKNKSKEFLYPNGYKEGLKLNLHL